MRELNFILLITNNREVVLETYPLNLVDQTWDQISDERIASTYSTAAQMIRTVRHYAPSLIRAAQNKSVQTITLITTRAITRMMIGAKQRVVSSMKATSGELYDSMSNLWTHSMSRLI